MRTTVKKQVVIIDDALDALEEFEATGKRNKFKEWLSKYEEDLKELDKSKGEDYVLYEMSK